MNKSISAVFCILLFLGLAGIGNNSDAQSKSAPAGSVAVKAAPATVVTQNDLARAIEGYIQRDSELKGGSFLLIDPKTRKPLQLKLDHVHTERLSVVSDNLYFACVDFKTAAGSTYDVDFFLKGTKGADLAVTEIMVHKENGKERYTWMQDENGFWKKAAKSGS
ncbi:MAG: hypothetical protein HY391_00170 [Deltaproteobacteria bacterium]|nr:hypothetical protein [Deltaproteobacteria bacterium]